MMSNRHRPLIRTLLCLGGLDALAVAVVFFPDSWIAALVAVHFLKNGADEIREIG